MKKKKIYLITVGLLLLVFFTFASASAWTVTYNGNGNGLSFGSPPVDPNSPYDSGKLVTVLEPGNMRFPGRDFSGWNTRRWGGGLSYSPGDTFTITANTVLYAQWTPMIRYTVTYDGNGARGTPPVDINSPYFSGKMVTVLDKGSLVMYGIAPNGFVFSGWNTKRWGGGVSYSPGDTFTITANTVLYAQWTQLTMTVKSPDGGERWQAGTKHRITWKQTGLTGTNVKLDLYKVGRYNFRGAYQYTIEPSVPAAQGTYSWIIPQNSRVGSNYKVKVTSLSYPAITDMTDEMFTITSPLPSLPNNEIGQVLGSGAE
jgi:uncharacterized repeat protein (TIGR02543 family)